MCEIDRSVIYVWNTGKWIYGADYHHGTHAALGEYQDFTIGQGFNIKEVNEMVNTYLKDLWEEDV